MMDYRSRTEHVFDHLFSFLGIPQKKFNLSFCTRGRSSALEVHFLVELF